jgi:hypothetical protein
MFDQQPNGTSDATVTRSSQSSIGLLEGLPTKRIADVCNVPLELVHPNVHALSIRALYKSCARIYSKLSSHGDRMMELMPLPQGHPLCL